MGGKGGCRCHVTAAAPQAGLLPHNVRFLRQIQNNLCLPLSVLEAFMFSSIEFHTWLRTHISVARFLVTGMKSELPLPAGTDIPDVPFYERRTVRLVGCVVGLMAAFLSYGVVQEKIMTKPYGYDEEGNEIYFGYSAWLVLNNRVVAIIGSFVILTLQGNDRTNVAPLYKYFGISFSNVVATYCQYEALKYVSFPTQTLGKCGKMVPVMVLSTFLLNKKYVLKDYLIAVAVTGGCTIFLLTGDIGGSREGKADTPLGLILMAGYLFSDGFTSTFQSKLFQDYKKKMSTYNQMLFVNACAACTTFLALTLKGEFFVSFEFAMEYPALLKDAFLLSLCSLIGQTIIYTTIKEFGPLIFSIVMTTRQFVAILLSSIIYIHPLSAGQWLGSVMVFGALYYKAVPRQSSKKLDDASAGKEPHK